MLQSFASILASYIAGDIRWFIAPVSLAPFLQCHTIDESSIFGKRCSLLSHELDSSRVQFDPVLSGRAVGSFALGLLLFRLFREKSKFTKIPTLEIIVHIFPKAQVASNKNAHKVWHHFWAQFFMLSHMMWSILFRVLALKTLKWKFLIGCWRTSTKE